MNRCIAIAVLVMLLGSRSLAQAVPPPTTPPPAAEALSPKPATGAGPQPPQYTPVRWNEDYLYLRDTDRSQDLFDPIKYIPLNDAGDLYLSLGGQARYRYEWFEDASFGAGPQDDDGYHLLRLLAHADLHLGQNVRFFVQGISALQTDRTGGERPFIDENDLDVHQAFVDVIVPLGDAEDAPTLLLRGGRQNLLYGAQRLISPLDWTNTRRTFDGGKASLAWPQNNTLDLFYVHPVVIDEGPLDSYDDDVTFTGLYDTLLLPDLLQGAGTRLEAYALYLDRESAVFGPGVAEENRYTLGGRFYTNPKPWDVDLEAAYQFGDFGDGDISAWMVAAEAGYTFADVPLKPRPFLGFTAASGDSDPGDDDLETFNQLFPLAHAFLGYIDLIGRQNVIDLHPGFELTLLAEQPKVKKLSFRAEYHLFWRQSDDDAVYNAAGGILRADLGSDDEYIGSELDLLLNWQIDRHLSAYIGYSHFFPGDFIDNTGPDDDIDFFYAAVQFTF